jgi:hypothetical protein
MAADMPLTPPARTFLDLAGDAGDDRVGGTQDLRARNHPYLFAA